MNSLTSNYSLKCQRNLTKVPSGYVFVQAQKTTKKNCCFKKYSTKFYFILQLLLTISPSMSLTSEERGELARKFKYYHKSVQPSEQFNIVDTINGTFFRLLTQMELVETRQIDNKAQLSLEMSLFVHFRDDRLQLRDLQDMPIPIPEEFQTWQPRIQLFPLGTTRGIQMQRMTNLSPKNGQLTVIHRYSGPLLCDFDQWKIPFERYQCQFWFETDPDERLHLTVVRDLRPNGQMFRINFEYEQWPWLLLRFHFHSGQWRGTMVSAFLPSLLLICCAILAQWKRRKIQVIVSLGAILALIFIQNGHQQANILAITNAINLFDLWFAGIFVHLICLLAADLLLPARRLLIFKRAYQRNQDEWQNSEKQQQKGYISTPSISQRKLDGFYSGRRIRATMFPGASSSSLHHHYVSSPQLGHIRQMPRQRAIARLPAAPIATDAPAQMIRTFSVPPRKLDDVRREQLEPSPLPPPMMGGSAPLSRKRTGLGGLDGQESDARERAIASLLCEMESIRRAEAGEANNRIIRRATSSEEDEEGFGIGGPSAEIVGTSIQIAQQPPTIPPPPPPPLPSIGRHFHYNSNQRYGDSNPRRVASQSSEDELGRLDGIGMPRRKRIVLYAILMSLCLFLCTYTLLAISALYDWL